MRPTLTSLLATDQEQRTALMNAALDGDTNKVRALLKLGADIDAHDAKGFTALMLAVINRHVETAKTLLHAGADSSARANDGVTALSLAASSGDGATMRVLMSHRAVVRAESAPSAATAVGPAARNGRAGMVKLLRKVRVMRGFT